MSNPHTPRGRTPAVTQALLSAVESGDASRVEPILAGGALADSASASGETPLMRAAARGYEDVARALLRAGADVNARRGDGFTPLILAVFFGHEALVRLLLEHGADASAETRLGTTAERWAEARGFGGVAELLRNAPAAARASAAPRRAEVARSVAVTIERFPAGLDDSAPEDDDADTVVEAEAEEVGKSAARRRDDFTFLSDFQRPSHPSAGRGFFGTWQAKAGAGLLLVACGVAGYAAWLNSRARVASTPPQAAPTPTLQTVATPLAAAAVTPSPLASPSPLPDAQQFPGMPPGAVAPYPTTGQPYYIPPDPALANAPQVPAVISESGQPEDPQRSRRRTDAATREQSAANTNADGQGREARADGDSNTARPDASTRPARPSAPTTDRQQPQPPSSSPTPAERRKVIQWPPQ